MILQSLYERHQNIGVKLPTGFQLKELPFIIVIDPDGTFVRVEGIGADPKAKVKQYLVPTAVGRTSAIVPNLFWDNFGYVLGLSKKDTDKDRAKTANQREAFAAQVKQFSELYPANAGFGAVAAFYDQKEYEKITSDLDLVAAITKKPGSNLSFRLSTEADPRNLIAGDADLRAYQDKHYLDSKADPGASNAICLITGKKGPVTRIHPGIKMGGMPISLVSFQVNSGYDSYGKQQALNAPVSPEAAEGYADALNALLGRDKSTNYFLSGITYVFWSSGKSDEDLVENFKSATFEPPMTTIEEESDSGSEKKKGKRKSKGSQKGSSRQIIDKKASRKVLSALKSIVGDKNALIDTDSSDRFYLMALEPGTGRISVKFFVEGTVKEIVHHTLQHLEDLKIYGDYTKTEEDEPVIRSIYSLIASSMPGALKADKWPKRPIEALVRSITTGAPYPADLYSSCIQRIKADRSVTELRAALIKAYINRNYRLKNHTSQNIITMALDKAQTNKGYLCGRLFALLESMQAAANDKATITDSYFSAASTTPGYIFPRLLNLSNHHYSKLIRDNEKVGLGRNLKKQIEEIMGLMGADEVPFPIRLTLEEQGYFSLGYYHQRRYNFMNKELKAQFDESSNN